LLFIKFGTDSFLQDAFIHIKFIEHDMKNGETTLGGKLYLIALISSIIAVLIIGSCFFYRSEKRTINKNKQEELKVISGLKIEQLTKWRKEREDDSKILSQEPLFVQEVEDWLSDKNNGYLRKDIIERLTILKKVSKYRDIFLASASGEVLLSSNNLIKLNSVLSQRITEAVKTQHIAFTDLYYLKAEESINLDIVAPIVNNNDKTVALLVLQINPDEYLYPLVQSWSAPGQSLETMILRKDNNDVLYLNELRYHKNSALKLTTPITLTNNPAVQAVLGYRGIFKGKDYRGVNVLAYINSVPEFNWFMISKVDIAEIYSKQTLKISVITLSSALIILLCCILLLRIYRTTQIPVSRELALKEKILTETKEEYRTTLYRIQKMNNDLFAAKEKAEEADKLKTAFLANMSHEIRTPMNAIIGLSSFLTEPGLSNEEINDYIEIINANSRQLLTIIDDIVDISTIEAGQVKIVTELVDINKLIKEIYLIYKKSVDLKKINLTCTSEQSNVLIQTMSDENRIKQVLCNLLNNAIKFTEEGEIDFGYKAKEKFIEFYVRDTGIGIAPENISLIFERFRQVEASHSRFFSGIGLGLSISKGLIEKMGGTIWASSEQGKGATFFFTIPYIQNTNIIDKPDRSVRTHSSVKWDNKIIMIVEDDQDNYAYIEKILSTTNVRIIHSWNGKDAVEKVKSHPEISLVLMDFKMPVMDGYEATGNIKALRPELPVIGHSAYALSHDITRALNAGCDEYISKPLLQKDLLIVTIGRYLERQYY
jgi:signal transduction histidine kinase/CheY-like chemotaxis protein